MVARRKENNISFRLLLIALLLCTWMIAIIWRLAWLQIVRHEDFARRAADIQRKELTVRAPRGEIVDRNGRPLAHTLLTDSVYADPRMLTKDEARAKVARALAPALGRQEKELVSQLGGDPQSEDKTIWLGRKLGLETAQAVKQALTKNRISGVSVKREAQRYYPSQMLAAHVVGYVDADDKGIEGLERVMENRLRGIAGETELARDAGGAAFLRQDRPAIGGAKVVTTIDSVLQHKVEVILEAALQQTHAKSASAVVLDPNNGEVLALVNAPSFNPNDRPKQMNARENFLRRNRALTDLYEPGSVFKIVAYAAALEEGVARPAEMINCQGGQIAFGKRIIRDSHLGLGTISVTDAFAKSSNVGAIKIAQRLGEEQLFKYIQRFGFGAKTGIELPGETKGMVHPLTKWRPDTIGSVAIGQEIGVSVLQIVSAMSALANRGVWVRPHVVKQIVSPGGSVLFETPVETRRVITEQTAQLMTAMLERVVTHGSGRAASQLAGYTAAGKTATPQKAGKGGYAAGKFMPSFTGFVPATNPRFAIIVMLDEPAGLHQGGQVAAPLFNLIAEAALSDYAVPPDDERFRTEIARIAETVRVKETEQEQRKAKAKAKAVEQTKVNQAGEQQKQQNKDSAAAPKRDAPAPLKLLLDVMPDLRGQNTRAVAQACTRLQLKVKLIGSGQAVRQAPAPGARLKAGGVCQVEFQ